MSIFKYPTIKGVNFDLASINMIIIKYPTIYILCIVYVLGFLCNNTVYFCHVMRLEGWTTIACLGLFPCFWPKSLSLLSCKYGFRCFSLYVHQFVCLSSTCLENWNFLLLWATLWNPFLPIYKLYYLKKNVLDEFWGGSLVTFLDLRIAMRLFDLYVYPLALPISVIGSIEFGIEDGIYHWQQEVQFTTSIYYFYYSEIFACEEVQF